MRIMGPRYQGWWHIAKMAKGDYMICSTWYLRYVPEGGKVFVYDKMGSGSMEYNIYGIRTHVSTDINPMFDQPIAAHYYDGRIRIGVTGVIQGRTVTFPLFMPNENLPLTYELLRLAGFKVVSPGAIWRSTLMTMRPRKYDSALLEEEVEYHVKQAISASAQLAALTREDHRIPDIDREIELIRQEPLVELVEVQPYRLIIYTKPIQISDGGYTWVNSYEITIDISNTMEPEILVDGHLSVRGVCHPHIMNGRICSNILGKVAFEVMCGRLHNAVLMILKILQSYDPQGSPYMTIPHLVEYVKRMEAVEE